MDSDLDEGPLFVQQLCEQRERRNRDIQERGNGKPSAKLWLQLSGGSVHTCRGKDSQNGFPIGGNAPASRLQLTYFSIRNHRIACGFAQNRLHAITVPRVVAQGNIFAFAHHLPGALQKSSKIQISGFFLTYNI
jgi:hypothetical protein